MAATPLLLGLVMPPPLSAAPGTAARASGRTAAAQTGWTPTGTLQVARDHHSATLLPNGKVLVAGGFAGTQFPDPDSTATAELYDPATGTWAATGSMSSPRAAHSAILLSNGKVLVVGGFHQNVPVLTAELYDPATGTWSLTGAMATPRASFAATALGNGDVLALGGYNPQSGTDLATAERYHPATGTWTPAASMGTPRYGHVVTLLADGRVLVAGGVNNANQGGLTSAERYDPVTNSWTPTGSMSQARENDEICCHQQVLLPTGDVLAIGGYNGGVLDSTERYRPATGSWSSAAPMQAAREGLHTATNLADGTVLVVGGLDDSGPVASAEVYYPTVDAWSTTAAPGAARAGHSATALPSGEVLVAGGIGANGDRLDSAELYEPPAAGALTPLAPARVLDTRSGNGAPVGKLGPNSTLSLQVTGRGGVPAGGVGAVLLNLTVTQPTAPSHLTIYADGSARPATSNLNFRADQTIANLTVARIGAGGRVRIYNLAGQTHVIADVAGWFATGPAGPGGLSPLAPARVLDTRSGNGAPAGKLGPNSTLSLQVTGRGGVPAAGVGAVLLNLTVTQPTAPSHLTIYADGSTRPATSNLNFRADQTLANLAVARIGSGGRVRIFNLAGQTHVIADVAGWFAAGPAGPGGLSPLAPARVLDTRSGNGAPAGKLGPNSTLSLQVTGRGGVPAGGVGAVFLNLTVTQPTAPSHLTVFADGSARPATSNLNFRPDQTIANLTVARIGAGGRVRIYNLAGQTHVIADVAGWFGT